MRLISTLCAVVLMTPGVGLAQISQPDIVQVDAGSRVRIAAPVFGPKKLVGSVVSLAHDTLVFRAGASTSLQPVATSDITALEVSIGKHTNKAKGALWGLFVGAGSGAILGYALYKKPTCDSNQIFGCFDILGPDSRGSNAAFSAAAGGIVGVLVGTLFGMHGTETWVPGAVGTR
jgi:hypothetical protein